MLTFEKEKSHDNQKFLIDQLTKVEEQYGELTPKNTVDYARPAESPIHKYFEWDDARAAEEHRIQQARSLIKRVYIYTEPDSKKEQYCVRYFHSVSSDESEKDRKYVNYYKAMNDEQLRDQVLKNAFRDMKSFSNKYSQFSELSSVLYAMNKLLEDEPA